MRRMRDTNRSEKKDKETDFSEYRIRRSCRRNLQSKITHKIARIFFSRQRESNRIDYNVRTRFASAASSAKRTYGREAFNFLASFSEVRAIRRWQRQRQRTRRRALFSSSHRASRLVLSAGFSPFLSLFQRQQVTTQYNPFCASEQTLSRLHNTYRYTWATTREGHVYNYV